MDTRIMNVSKKGFKKGLTEGHQLKNPMVFVEQELTYYNEGKRTAEVVERRSHVYLPIHASANERAVKKGKFIRGCLCPFASISNQLFAGSREPS